MIRIAATVVLSLVAGAAFAQQTALAPGAMLRALDKVSGKTTDIEVGAGQSVRFGRLQISLRECRYPSGNRAGDAFAGLEIWELGMAEPSFKGWMIASAPALSAMDHPRYDVWVIRCTNA